MSATIADFFFVILILVSSHDPKLLLLSALVANLLSFAYDRDSLINLVGYMTFNGDRMDGFINVVFSNHY